MLRLIESRGSHGGLELPQQLGEPELNRRVRMVRKALCRRRPHRFLQIAPRTQTMDLCGGAGTNLQRLPDLVGGHAVDRGGARDQAGCQLLRLVTVRLHAHRLEHLDGLRLHRLADARRHPGARDGDPERRQIVTRHVQALGDRGGAQRLGDG